MYGHYQTYTYMYGRCYMYIHTHTFTQSPGRADPRKSPADRVHTHIGISTSYTYTHIRTYHHLSAQPLARLLQIMLLRQRILPNRVLDITHLVYQSQKLFRCQIPYDKNQLTLRTPKTARTCVRTSSPREGDQKENQGYEPRPLPPRNYFTPHPLT